MVSKASEDLPEPETPVTTVRLLCGISKSIFLRLWTRAPRTIMLSVDIDTGTAAARTSPRRQHVFRRCLLEASGGLQNLSIIRQVDGGNLKMVIQCGLLFSLRSLRAFLCELCDSAFKFVSPPVSQKRIAEPAEKSPQRSQRHHGQECWHESCNE